MQRVTPPQGKLLRLVLQTPFFEVLSKSLGLKFIGLDPRDRPKAWGRQIVNKLPLGQAVAIANLKSCGSTDIVAKMLEFHGHEIAFGDYSPGRWAWKLEDIYPLAPIPVQGSLGLFDLDLPIHLGGPFQQGKKRSQRT